MLRHATYKFSLFWFLVKKVDTQIAEETENEVNAYETLQTLGTPEHMYTAPLPQDNSTLDYDYVKIIWQMTLCVPLKEGNVLEN